MKYEESVNDPSVEGGKRYGEWIAPHSRYPGNGDARVDGVIVFEENRGTIFYKVRGDKDDPIVNITVDQSNENRNFVFSGGISPGYAKTAKNIILDKWESTYVFASLKVFTENFDDMRNWIEYMRKSSNLETDNNYYVNSIQEQLMNIRITGNYFENRVGIMPYY